jgi:hypothetical protein
MDEPARSLAQSCTLAAGRVAEFHGVQEDIDLNYFVTVVESVLHRPRFWQILEGLRLRTDFDDGTTDDMPLICPLQQDQQDPYPYVHHHEGHWFAESHESFQMRSLLSFVTGALVWLVRDDRLPLHGRIDVLFTVVSFTNGILPFVKPPSDEAIKEWEQGRCRE